MKKYIGTKLIQSKPMNRADYNVYRGWELPSDEDGSDEGYLVEYLDGGKPNHPDHEGYISWSPEEQFDNAYRKTDGMNFGLATEAAHRGKRVAREGWNGTGMYAYIVPSRTEENSGPGCLAVPYIYFREHWALKTAQNDIATWAPSGSDSLADDWIIVN